MRRQRLREQRTGRDRELERHRDDLEPVAERGRDQLDHLADRQHLLVADVEDLARRRVGLLDREQQRVREVLGVAVMVQREAVVGDDDAVAAVEDPAHDEPFARHELMRAVHVRVAEVRGAGMVGEHRLLGAHDAVALLVVLGSVDGRRVLRDRNRQARRIEQPRVHPAAVRGHAADRDELADAARGQLRDAPQPPVHRDDDVERLRPSKQRAQRVVVVRVGVDVRDLGRRLGAFVQAAVHDRDVVAAVDQAAHQRDAGRAGPADHQGARHEAARYPPAAARPRECGADLLQRRLGRVVAQCAGDAGAERALRPTGRGSSAAVVVAGEVGVEHRGVVGADRAQHAGVEHRRQRVVLERRRRPACAGSTPGTRRTRCRAPRSRRAGRGSSTARMPWRSRSAPSASSAPRIDATPSVSPACGTEPSPPSFAMRNAGRERLGREPGLAAAEARGRRRRGRGTSPSTRAVSSAASTGNPRGMSGVSRTSTPVVSFASSRAVAEAGEHLVPRRAAARPVRPGEDPLDVDRAVRGRLLRVRHHDLAEVDLGPDDVRGHHPELDEVVEVAELVELGELVDVVRRQASDRCVPRSR